jgi:hypothetical protein
MVEQADPRDLKAGQLVDGWRVVRRLGSGTYGAVYEAEKDGRRVALKMACHREGTADQAKVEARALREVACLQQLNHPNIVRIWGYGRWPDPLSSTLYIVQDFIDGCTLGEWGSRRFPTPHDVALIMVKAFDALEHIHGRNMVHRDLSLRNLMISKSGEPVIIDFGAADYATAETLTDGPLPPGTPRNRSPQATRFWLDNLHNPGARYPFQPADDIFALGASFYDVLTEPQLTKGEPRPPLGSALVPVSTPFKLSNGRVPQELSAFVMALIAKNPEERTQSATDAKRIAQDLARSEGEAWRGTTVHPVALQLPPEPAAEVPAAVEKPQPRGAEMEPVVEAPAAQGAPASEHAVPVPAVAPLPVTRETSPVQVEPVPLGGLASGVTSMRRRGWLRPAYVGPVALLALAAVVAIAALAEKPTSPNAPLPSPLPIQNEERYTVKPPDNSPTLTQGIPDLIAKAAQCALLVASVAWLEAGCSGVQLRPEPEACPDKAIEAMKEELGWSLETQAGILIDVTQPHPDDVGEEPTDANVVGAFKDGPVTGALDEPEGKAPKGTRLDGHLWTTGDRIYGRYVRAHLPDGRTVPICVELGATNYVGEYKESGSKAGHAVTGKVVSGWITPRWR